MRLKRIKIRKSCQTCDGRCCQVMDVLLNEEEESKYHHTVNYNDFLTRQVLLKKHKDGWCVYFDRKNRRCSIYEDRPSACKRWYCGRNGPKDEGWKMVCEAYQAR